MNQPRLVCLSLTPNLRCISFTLGQSVALIIPPAIEVIFSLLFISLYSGPVKRMQILLAVDGLLYFIWALLDMLSHVAPSSNFKALDFFVGAVSFTPILIYSVYLYQLSFRDFIPTLPRKLQPYLEFSLPILSLTAVIINQVSSFVGVNLGQTSNQSPVVTFSDNNESLWFHLSHASLTIYTIVQLFFFLLAFSRLCWAFLDQRRIELTHSDEHHYLHGVHWITAGIFLGVVESIVGFARISFGMALARRILRLVARAVLMFGLLKGLDVTENFENLTDELRGLSRISKRIPRMLGVHTQQACMFRRLSQSNSQSSTADEHSEREQRVTVRYERGQAPFLQIRFSTLDFPAQAMLADVAQQRRRSLSGLISGRANAGSSTLQYKGNASDEMVAAPRVKSEIITSNGRPPPEWVWPPEMHNSKRGSGGTIPDNLSVVRDLERRFPNLPPRVTGKYRGSILGQGYEEDPFPVVGISRQSSLRQDGGAHNPSDEGGTSTTLSPSNSIKRKPAPPLLDVAHISNRRGRRVSTWGGLTETIDCPMVSPVVSPSPVSPTASSLLESTAIHSPNPTLDGEPNTPRSRRMTAHDIIKRASRAMSDVSIRSAEWLASARSHQPAGNPVTAADIEMYRRGNVGPGSARPPPPGDNLAKASDETAGAGAAVHRV